MLSSIRKFSRTITAKIFLFVVAIPFIFWGMGDVFSGGNLNTIAKIGSDKISTKEFVNYIQNYSRSGKEVSENTIDGLLSNFIGEKLIFKEVEDFNIVISDLSLSRLIKNEEIFKRDGIFSRTEYEKFLIENSIDAVTLESNILKQEKRKQLLDLISGGLLPSKHFVNINYNKINQKREIEIIELSDFFKKELKFTEEEINNEYKNNIEEYKQAFKTFLYIELESEALTGSEDFSDIYFKKIDEIDDLIVESKNLEFLIRKFNLPKAKKITLDVNGTSQDLSNNKDLSDGMKKILLKINELKSTALIEYQNKYYLAELDSKKIVEEDIKASVTREKVLISLKSKKKKNIIMEIIDKINKNNFNKNNFNEFASKNNILIKKIKTKSLNDNKILKAEILNQIYSFPKKKVIIVNDQNLNESYLVYTAAVESVTINDNSDEYKKYYDLSKIEITNNIYTTYDLYLKNKYKIDINNKSLNNIKSSFK